MCHAAVSGAQQAQRLARLFEDAVTAPQAPCQRLRVAGLLSSTRRHSVASRSAIAAPLLHGQSPRTLRGQVLVPGVDLGDLRPKIWLSSCVWAFSRHSPSADRGSDSPKTTSAGSRGVDLCARVGSGWKRSQYCCRWRGAFLTALDSGPAGHRCYLAFRVWCGEETTAHRIPSFQELSWSRRIDSRCGRSLSRKSEKAALCFFTSWFAKKSFRIQRLLMVVTGVLLVYAVVQR